MGPACPRCGLPPADYVRRHRRRLGIGWLHGTCKCCDDCLNSVDVTISNVSGNSCTNCVQPDGSSSWWEVLTLQLIDGTYSVSFSSGPNANGECVYNTTFDSFDDWLEESEEHGNSSCSDLLGTFQLQWLFVEVKVDHSATTPIKELFVELKGDGSLGAGGDRDLLVDRDTDDGDAAFNFGDIINPSGDCSGRYAVQDTATFEVNTP